MTKREEEKKKKRKEGRLFRLKETNITKKTNVEIQNQKGKTMNPRFLSHYHFIVQSTTGNFLGPSLGLWSHQYCNLDAIGGQDCLEGVMWCGGDSGHGERSREWEEV